MLKNDRLAFLNNDRLAFLQDFSLKRTEYRSFVLLFRKRHVFSFTFA